MKYKLVLSDFDGTLRRTQGGISEGNARAIRAFSDAGGIFVLCTGRMLSSIRPYAEQLCLSGYLSAYQGAVIQDVSTGEFVRDKRIPNADAVRICEFLQRGGRHVHVYDGDDFYVNVDDQFRAWYEQICKVRGILTNTDIASVVREKHICPHKILVVCEASDREEILGEAQRVFGEEFYVTTSTANLVEIVSKGCDKGDALRFIAERYGIPLRETIACGDNFNDLPMIRAAGLGVAVENAEEELRRAADYVTRSCDEDGVGYVIRKFCLGENI